MSVRRRQIRDRIQREARLAEGISVFQRPLDQILDAITAARARGETTCTERFLIEAFHEQPRMETKVAETPAPLCSCPINECLEQHGKRCKDDK